MLTQAAVLNTDWIVELAAWLGLPQGDAYRRLYLFLPRWLLASLALAGLGTGAWLLIRRRVLAAWPLGAAPLPRSGIGGLVVICVAILAVCDGPGFLHSFFRQDDFSFLQVVRENQEVGRQLWLIHNDHLCPLFRLEVWTIMTLAGPGASVTALSYWFSVFAFVVCLGFLLAGSWLLHELGCSKWGLLAFICFVWLWPGWGEFTAGYYSCSTFIQIVALSCASCAALLRGLRLGVVAWLAGSLAMAIMAAGVDVSGVHVFLPLATLALAWLWRQRDHRLARKYLFTLGPVFIAIFLFFFIAARQAASPREFVQNPAGTSLSLATLATNLLHHAPSAFLTAIVAPGGLILNYFTPTFLQFAVLDDTVPAKLFWAFLVVQLAALIFLAWLAPRAWRRFSGSDRPFLLALIANMLIGLGMVLAARTTYAIDVPVPLWHARYLLMPMCWLVLAAVLIADRLWLSSPLPTNRTPAYFFAALLLGGWLAASSWHLERAVLPEALSYVPRGRWGNVHNAKVRAGEYQKVLADLAAIAERQGGGKILLPEPQRWNAAFFSLYQFLEWGGDVGPRGVTYLFWDLPAASPDQGLSGHWAPAESFSPADREYLVGYPWLKGAFATESAPVGH